MKIYKLDNKLMLSSDGKLYVKPEAEKLIIDGLEYRTVTMPDGRVWMAENLQATEGDAMFYDNDEVTYGRNGKNYGRLYTRSEALAAAAKVEGWHLPSDTEWQALFAAVGGKDVAGTKLKSKTLWTSGPGTDDYGFSILPAGYFAQWGFCTGEGTMNHLSTTVMILFTTRISYSVNETSSITTYSNTNLSERYSVRLIKDI